MLYLVIAQLILLDWRIRNVEPDIPDAVPAQDDFSADGDQ
jgi:hypothetical protein